MAPEQASGRSSEVTTATDVYGLGSILHAILTGRPPFQGLSQLDVLEKVRHREPDRPRSIDRRVDAELETICPKCLEKEPARRYAGAEALAEDLERWLDGRPILAQRAGPIRRAAKWSRRRPATALLSAALALGAPAAFVATYAAYRDSERKRLELDASLYQARIALAEREIGQGNADRAEALLLEWPERLRGWEWRLLLQRSRTSPISLTTPGDSAESVAFSPDGRRLAVGSHKPIVRIWDPSTGRELARIETKTEVNNAVAFSPDGGRIAAASMVGALEVWDAGTGRSLWGGFDGQGRWAVTFSPDGQALATAGFDGTIRLLDSATGKELRKLEGHADRVTGVAFRPDGRVLASSSDDGSVRLWEPSSGRELRAIRDDLSLPLRRVAFSPDGKLLAGGSVGGAVVAWDAETGREVFRGTRHANEIHDLAFSPDGQLLASAAADATIRVFSPTDGRELISLRGISRTSTASPSVPMASGWPRPAWTASVRLWDARPWEPVAEGKARVLGKTGGFADDVAFSPDGRLVAATGRDQFLCVWDVETGRKVREVDAGVGSLRCPTFDPTGRYVATAGFGKTVRVIGSETWQAVATLPGHARAIGNLALPRREPPGLRRGGPNPRDLGPGETCPRPSRDLRRGFHLPHRLQPRRLPGRRGGRERGPCGRAVDRETARQARPGPRGGSTGWTTAPTAGGSPWPGRTGRSSCIGRATGRSNA